MYFFIEFKLTDFYDSMDSSQKCFLASLEKQDLTQ